VLQISNENIPMTWRAGAPEGLRTPIFDWQL
jgi:hypothetical protein